MRNVLYCATEEWNVKIELLMLYYNTLLLHKIDKIKMAATSRELWSVMEENDNRLNSSVRIKTRIRTEVT